MLGPFFTLLQMAGGSIAAVAAATGVELAYTL
jgi:hypothetical protein